MGWSEEHAQIEWRQWWADRPGSEDPGDEYMLEWWLDRPQDAEGRTLWLETLGDSQAREYDACERVMDAAFLAGTSDERVRGDSPHA